MTTTIEVRNDTEREVRPVCVLLFGSQRALIDTKDAQVQPGEKVWLSGVSEFPRPLDDYESGDASCYDRMPPELEQDLSRQRRLLEMGRPTRVPNLVGKPLDARLPSFRNGLDVSVAEEETPCTLEQLAEVARSFPAFKPVCGRPRVVTQDPTPGSQARVGDEVVITVIASR